jgi:hypothetical protein
LKSESSGPATARISALVRPLVVTGEATRRAGQRLSRLLSKGESRKPGSAGRETPDDRPDATCARILSDESTRARSARPSPGQAKQRVRLLVVEDQGEGGRRLARPAFPTGFPCRHGGFTNDFDKTPRLHG